MCRSEKETQSLIDNIFVEVLQELTTSILVCAHKASDSILSTSKNFLAKQSSKSQVEKVLLPVFSSFSFEESLRGRLNDVVERWKKMIEQDHEVIKVNEHKASLVTLMQFSTSSFDRCCKESEAATFKVVKSIKELTSGAQEGGVKEIDGFVSPVVEALQFQDRIVQNMNNLSKMLGVWIDCHQKILAGGECKDQELTEFGKKLLACSTTHSEKEIIEQKFQMLTRNDNQKPGDVLLF